MKQICFLFLFFTLSALACEIQLPHHIVVFSQNTTSKSVTANNCRTEVLDHLAKELGNLEGRIANYQLQEMMSSKGFEVSLQPQSVLIQQFRTLIRNQLPLPTGVQVKSSSLDGALGMLELNAGDQLEISCQSCLFGTHQPVNINITGFDGTTRSLIANVDFVKMVKAYKLTAPLAAFSTIDDHSILTEEFTESIPHTDLITDKTSLKFFKTNKPLKAGDLLKLSDLNAINIVKAGLKTDVILENKMIRIKTQGISRSNGTFGELVEVYHPQKNKKYQGKVIDNNKVLVEL